MLGTRGVTLKMVKRREDNQGGDLDCVELNGTTSLTEGSVPKGIQTSNDGAIGSTISMTHQSRIPIFVPIRVY